MEKNLKCDTWDSRRLGRLSCTGLRWRRTKEPLLFWLGLGNRVLLCSLCSFVLWTLIISDPVYETPLQIRHIKNKFVTTQTKLSQQKQIIHIKNKSVESKTKSSVQKQIFHIKNKFVTTQTNSSHQKQISQIKNKVVRWKKFFTSKIHSSPHKQNCHHKNKSHTSKTN